MTRTKLIEVPVAVYRPVPSRLVEPIAVPELPAGDLSNGDLLRQNAALRQIVGRCIVDREALREMQP